MKKLISAVSLAALFFGCSYGTLFDGNGHSDSYSSVLSEVLSSTAVLPPQNVQAVISTKNGKHTILLSWDSVPNTKEYSVSVSGDKTINDDRTGAAQYSFEAEMASGEDFKAVAVVKTININGKISAAGKSVDIAFGSDAVYSEKVQNFYASRGDETAVKLTYSRVKDADSYFLERKQTGAPDEQYEILVAKLINPDLTASEYYYYDQTAKEGYRYDYRISPVDIDGIKGEPAVAGAGFVLPLVRNLSAGQGGEGIYNDYKGIFCVSWEVQSVLYDYGDTRVVDDKLTAMLNQLSFEIRVASSASGIGSIAMPNFSSQWLTVSSSFSGFSNYKDGDTGFTGLKTGTVYQTTAGCTIYTDEPGETGTVNRYYMYIIVDGENSEMYRTQAYFQVRPSYGSSVNATLPWSNMAYGYVVSPTDAAKCSGGVTGITVTDAGNGTVQISWSGNSTTGTWAVYAKASGEAGFTYIGEAASSPAELPFPLESGNYYFGVAATSNAAEGAGIIYSTAEMVTVSVPDNRQTEE